MAFILDFSSLFALRRVKRLNNSFTLATLDVSMLSVDRSLIALCKPKGGWELGAVHWHLRATAGRCMGLTKKADSTREIYNRRTTVRLYIPCHRSCAVVRGAMPERRRERLVTPIWPNSAGGARWQEMCYLGPGLVHLCGSFQFKNCVNKFAVA